MSKSVIVAAGILAAQGQRRQPAAIRRDRQRRGLCTPRTFHRPRQFSGTGIPQTGHVPRLSDGGTGSQIEMETYL